MHFNPYPVITKSILAKIARHSLSYTCYKLPATNSGRVAQYHASLVIDWTGLPYGARAFVTRKRFSSLEPTFPYRVVSPAKTLAGKHQGLPEHVF